MVNQRIHLYKTFKRCIENLENYNIENITFFYFDFKSNYLFHIIKYVSNISFIYLFLIIFLILQIELC